MSIEETITELKAANAICEKTASHIEAALKHMESILRGVLDIQDNIVRSVKKIQPLHEPSDKALLPADESELG